jgi:hypothetical protein
MRVPQTVNCAQTASGLAAETPPLRVDDLQGRSVKQFRWRRSGTLLVRLVPCPCRAIVLRVAC